MLGLIQVLAAALLAAAPLAPTGGDPRAGEALYVGAARLEGGGAPCLACHALAGHGLAWSASFGPDLSTVAASYDAETLATVLEDVPFPSMAPIYRSHAISGVERAHLAAFLLATRAPAPARDARAALLVEAGAGVLAGLGVLLLLARRRMPPVRDALRRASRAAGGPR